MKLLGYVLIIGTTGWVSCTNNTNISKNDVYEVQEEKHNVEVTDSIVLRHDALLKFVIIEDEQFLLLERSGKLVDTISSCSKGLPMKNLGYLVEDFDDNFVLAQSFGSGNPHNVYLYSKKTGQNELGRNSYFIDIDTASRTLFYSTSDVPSIDDTLFSVNVMTSNKSMYAFPKAVLDEEEILNRIHVSKVNGSDVTVEIEYQNWKKKQTKKLESR